MTPLPAAGRSMLVRLLGLVAVLLLMISAEHSLLADTLTLSAPKPRQIIQRNSNNHADVKVTGNWVGTALRLEARAIVMAGATNNGVSTDWVTIVHAPTNGVFSGVLPNVTGGGWYRIEVRAVDADTNSLLSVSVDRVGIGDIFVTAGQSNAGCFGSPQQSPTDDRVSAFVLLNKSWQLGKDAQPDNSGGVGQGGSPWPSSGQPFDRIESGSGWFYWIGGRRFSFKHVAARHRLLQATHQRAANFWRERRACSSVASRRNGRRQRHSRRYLFADVE